jgi:hypothetical protein
MVKANSIAALQYDMKPGICYTDVYENGKSNQYCAIMNGLITVCYSLLVLKVHTNGEHGISLHARDILVGIHRTGEIFFIEKIIHFQFAIQIVFSISQ